ncbi:MAG: hypothetical protein ACREBS_11100 [Nitrososphaerales archaeon]
MGVFYNRNIDQIAMVCPVCERVRGKRGLLSDQDLEKYEEHLREKHGLAR